MVVARHHCKNRSRERSESHVRVRLACPSKSGRWKQGGSLLAFSRAGLSMIKNSKLAKNESSKPTVKAFKLSPLSCTHRHFFMTLLHIFLLKGDIL